VFAGKQARSELTENGEVEARILAHPYFTSEEPAPERPVELALIDGDWHEYESKALRKEKEKAERDARRRERDLEKEKQKAEKEGEKRKAEDEAGGAEAKRVKTDTAAPAV
jgi:CTD kinase subunit alpha